MQRGGRPFTGAWIETDCPARFEAKYVVAPSRGRGLKQTAEELHDTIDRRPFTGAWIETSPISIEE